jgi:2-polyprenyl-3-methyl-5-hydroxy-6-metoxy-1,4-benzoquinol methylase
MGPGMAQNIYDDPAFFAGYSEFPRSRDGLSATSEWPAFRALLPTIVGKRVIDLGCGFGQLSRWMAEQGGQSVHGYDLSEKMLERAVRETRSPAVKYDRADLETLKLKPHSAELVVSSMALHYLHDFERVATTVYDALMPNGDFVFSVEHPIYAARAEPEWIETANGERAFAITGYSVEGKRVTNWIADGVVKYHRTIATMLNTLHDIGFEFVALNEWRPTAAELEKRPDWQDELHRPMFLLVSVHKPETAN